MFHFLALLDLSAEALYLLLLGFLDLWVEQYLDHISLSSASLPHASSLRHSFALLKDLGFKASMLRRRMSNFVIISSLALQVHPVRAHALEMLMKKCNLAVSKIEQTSSLLVDAREHPFVVADVIVDCDRRISDACHGHENGLQILR